MTVQELIDELMKVDDKNKLFKFRKFNLQFLIYKCRKYVSYLPPC